MASNRQEARTRNQQQDIFALSTHAPTPAPFPSAETPFRGTPSPLPSPLAPPRSPLASGYFQPHRDLYTSHEPPPHPAGQPPASLPSGHAMRPPEGPISQPFGHQQFPIFQSPSAPTTPGRSPGLEPRLAPPPSYEAHAFQSSLPGFPPGAPPNAGRFPRWRGWLEKRAVERHLARQDAATDASGMRRKKSWGAGVNDPDAVSDDDEDSDGNDDESQAVRNLPALPPLHLHHFGSRFIPHLQSQPLCSAFLDVPRADSLQPNRPLSSYPRRMRSSFTRKVLLIGTVEGLYALETREVPTSRQRAKERSKESDRNEDWNQDVRCVQVRTRFRALLIHGRHL